LQLWPLAAQAEDGPAGPVRSRPQPVEPIAVPITLQPAASDAEVASWRQWRTDGPRTIAERSPESAAPAQPRLEQLETVPIMVQSAGYAGIVQPRQGQFDAVPVMVQPATSATAPEPRSAPETILEDVTRDEMPSLPERRPGSLANAPIASPRPKPATTQNDEAAAAIPSLPGRSPFRHTPLKNEIAAAPAPVRQQTPAPANGSAAGRFLANLWPGNKGASTPVSSTAEAGPSSAGDGKVAQAEAGAKADKPPIKRLLDGIQFWKN
jgi:hypothetical protein